MAEELEAIIGAGMLSLGSCLRILSLDAMLMCNLSTWQLFACSLCGGWWVRKQDVHRRLGAEKVCLVLLTSRAACAEALEDQAEGEAEADLHPKAVEAETRTERSCMLEKAARQSLLKWVVTTSMHCQSWNRVQCQVQTVAVSHSAT